MNENEMQEKAFEAVRKDFAHAAPTDLYVRAKVKKFLDGTLFFVNYKSNNNAKDYQVYVYLRDDDDAMTLKSSEELAKMMSVHRPESATYKVLKELFSVAGIIAILVTITICVLIIYNKGLEPPEILSAALTSILGFYFGSQVTKK
jgi:hypothetical protein